MAQAALGAGGAAHDAVDKLIAATIDDGGVRRSIDELSAAAVEILKALPRIPGNAYAINGQRPGKHIVSLQVPWKKICVKAGVTSCRVHDLRHSFASFAASEGLSLLMIGKLLGHKTPATTARYAHLTDSALKRANEGIGARLGGLLSATVKVRGVKSDG